MFEFSFNREPCQAKLLILHAPGKRKAAKICDRTADARDAEPRDGLALPRPLFRRFVVAKHTLPGNAAVSNDKSVIFFPPRQISSLPAQKANHLQKIVDLRRAQRRLKGRHQTASLGDDFPDLTVAVALDGIAEVGGIHRQEFGHRAIASAPGAVAIETALGVKQIHPLVAPAADGNGQQE